ncbi:MAG TPA: hypothetical protein VJN93_03290 [Candidatus Acidoferrum sp.]|nr:hypothetical protein [Candidatus Acidoferrum sp.]
MNRAFAIVLIPVVLVAIGYLLVFQAAGGSTGYGKLAGIAGVLGAGMLWLWHKLRGGRDRE